MQCSPRPEALPGRCVSSLLLNRFAGSCDGCSLPTCPPTVCSFRISVSSSLRDSYDEPEILRYSSHSICPIGADVRQPLSNSNSTISIPGGLAFRNVTIGVFLKQSSGIDHRCCILGRTRPANPEYQPTGLVQVWLFPCMAPLHVSVPARACQLL